MKFFTYHSVRWDDAAVAHDPAMARAVGANVQRPITWAAPHIRNASTWAEAVQRPAGKERP